MRISDWSSDVCSSDLFIVDSYNQHRIRRIQQLLRHQQTPLYHCQPFAMTVEIVALNIIVVVLPILCPSVVRRIYIDSIHLTPMWVGQRFEDVIGFTIDDRTEEQTSELQSLMRISYAVC